MTRAGVESQIYLQNAPLVMIPFVAVFGITAWIFLKSVPIKSELPRAIRYLQFGSHLGADIALHHDLWRLLRAGCDIPAANPLDLWCL